MLNELKNIIQLGLNAGYNARRIDRAMSEPAVWDEKWVKGLCPSANPTLRTAFARHFKQAYYA